MHFRCVNLLSPAKFTEKNCQIAGWQISYFEIEAKETEIAICFRSFQIVFRYKTFIDLLFPSIYYRAADADYVDAWKWRPHEEAIKLCKTAGLEQSAYFLTKDLSFRKVQFISYVYSHLLI